MDLVLKNLTGTKFWIFIDDVIVYSDTTEENAKRVAGVFEQLRRANLQLQPEKCVLGKTRILSYDLNCLTELLRHRRIRERRYKFPSTQISEGC